MFLMDKMYRVYIQNNYDNITKASQARQNHDTRLLLKCIRYKIIKTEMTFGYLLRGSYPNNNATSKPKH